MKQIYGMIVISLILGCGKAPTSGSGGDTGGSGSTTFSVKASSGCIYYKPNPGAASCVSLDTSHMLIKDDAANDFWFTVITFPLAGRPTAYTSAKLNLYYHTNYALPITNLGTLSARRLAGTSTLTVANSQNGVTEYQTQNIYTSDGQLAGLPDTTLVQIDILPMLNASILAGESYLTIAVRTTNLNVADGVSNGIEFYGDLTSVPLDSLAPRVVIQ